MRARALLAVAAFVPAGFLVWLVAGENGESARSGLRAGESPTDPRGKPASGEWTRLPLPPEIRDGAALVWTGSELLAWGGCAPQEAHDCAPTADGYAFDPESADWQVMPEAPRAARTAEGFWTGEEAIFLGPGQGGALLAQAYDPVVEAWRTIATAPIDSASGAVEVWTGSELIVSGGGEVSAPRLGGAAYDPEADAWRRIADAPVGLNLASAVWTGREMIAFGSLLDRRNWAETKTSVGAAYDPRTDRWREVEPSQLSPQATSAVWAGDSMVAWDYLTRSQDYDPDRDGWSRRLKMPLRAGECYPESVEVAGLVFAFYCGQAALYEPESRRWKEIDGGLVDREVFSEAYERSLKVWRFADLVAAGNALFLLAEGLTLNRRGTACYGCRGSPHSFWAYRPPGS